MPVFTVAITTYNRPDYLKRAMGSILNQTYADFEFLIIDDASEPETRQAVESFTDPRIRYIRNSENKKIAHNVNLAFELAQGRYICFLGDDDMYAPNFLEKAHNVFTQHKDIRWVGVNIRVVDNNNIELDSNYMNIAKDMFFKPKQYIEYHFGTQQFHIPGTFVVDVDFIRQNHLRFRPEVKGIDVFFSIECNLYTSIYVIADPLYIHTSHPDQDGKKVMQNHLSMMDYNDALYKLVSDADLLHLLPFLVRMANYDAERYVSELCLCYSDTEFENKYQEFMKCYPWLLDKRALFGCFDVFECFKHIKQLTDKRHLPVAKLNLSIPCDFLSANAIQVQGLWLTQIASKQIGITRYLKSKGIRRIAIFGTLLNAFYIMQDAHFEGIEVCAFIDSNIEKQTKEFIGIEICSPSSIPQDVEAIILSVERADDSVLRKIAQEHFEGEIFSWRELAQLTYKSFGNEKR